MKASQRAGAMSEAENEARVRKVELLISSLLRTGVMLSLTLAVLGTVLSFIQHPEYLSGQAASLHLIGRGSSVSHSLAEVASGLKALKGEAIVTLGILLLIATPVIRVGVSIFAFIYQRDRLYTCITAMVFCLLLLSFILGKVE
jgi:uncharacterized membrane protein